MLGLLLRSKTHICQDDDFQSDITDLTDGTYYNVADKENISVVLSPDLSVCNNKHIFVVTSAPKNKNVRIKGNNDKLKVDNIKSLYSSEGSIEEQSWYYISDGEVRRC